MRDYVIACLLIVSALVYPAAATGKDGKSATSVISFVAERDTMINRESPNSNEGGSPLLFVRSKSPDRVLLGFNQARIRAKIKKRPLLKAELVLRVTTQGKDFTKEGARLALYRLNTWWAEGNGWTVGNRSGKPDAGNGTGATWGCPWDLTIQNDVADCKKHSWYFPWLAPSGQSGTPPYDRLPVDVVEVGNDTERGSEVRFDITEEMQKLQEIHGNKLSAHQGWVVAHHVDPGVGTLVFGARNMPKAEPRIELVISDVEVPNASPVLSLPSGATVTSLGALTAVLGIADPDSESFLIEAAWGDGLDEVYKTGGELKLTHQYIEPGAYTVFVRVTDDYGNTAELIFEVEAPIQSPVAKLKLNTTVPEGTPLLAAGKADIQPGLAVTTWLAWGDGAGEAGVLKSADDAIQATHSYADNGTYLLTFSAMVNGAAPYTVDATVVVTNVAPTIDAPELLIGAPGVPVSLSGTVTDPGADTLALSMDTGAGPTVVALANDGAFALEPVFATPGLHTVTLGATDDDGGSAEHVIEFEIVAPIPALTLGEPQTIDEGSKFVAMAMVEHLDSIVLDYGDGTIQEKTVYEGVVGLHHTYVEDGVYSVSAAGKSPGGHASESMVVTVINVAPIVMMNAVTMSAPIVVLAGATFSAEGSFADPGALDTHSVSVLVSGDDAAQPSAQLDGTSLSASVTAPEPGDYVLHVTVTDDDGGVGEASLPFTVLPPLSGGPDQTITEGSASTISGAAAVPTLVQWGDGTPTQELTPVDGQFSAEHVYGDDGVYTVRLTTLVHEQEDEVSITVVNVAPSIDASLSAAELAPGKTLALSGTVVDPGDDLLTATVDWGDDTVESLAISHGAIEATHAYALPGTFEIVVTAADDDGGESSQTLTTTMTLPATLDLTAPQAGEEGSPSILSGTAEGVDKVSISWGDGSADESVAVVDGILIAEHTWADDGDFVVFVSGSGVQSEVVITVANVAPSVSASVASPTVAPGQPVEVSGGVFDPGADSLTATIAWGDGPVVELPLENLAFAAAAAFAEAGETTIAIVVSDEDGGSTTHHLSVSVVAAPTLDVTAPATSDEGSALLLTASVTGVDELSVAWGDGQVSVLATVEGSAEASHTYVDDGTYSVAVSGQAVHYQTTVVVNNVAPAVNMPPEAIGVVGIPLALTGTFADPGADSHTAAAWQVGPQDISLLTDVAPSTLVVTHTFDLPGDYTVRSAVKDDEGAVGEALTTVTISAALDAGDDVTLDEGTALQRIGVSTQPVLVSWGDETPDIELAVVDGAYELDHVYADNGVYELRLTDAANAQKDTATITVLNVAPTLTVSGANGPAYVGEAAVIGVSAADPGDDTLLARIVWGDGTSTEPFAIGDTALEAAHTYQKPGEYLVEIEVADDDGAHDDATIALVVSPLASLTLTLPEVGDEGAPIALNGTVLVSDAAPSWEATVDWGDETIETLLVGPQGTVAATHTYADDGEYTVAVNAAGVAWTAQVHIANVAPTLTLPGTLEVVAGVPFIIDGTVTDPGADTVSVTVAWDDADPSSVPVEDSGVRLEHTLETPGQYVAAVSASDEDGGTSIVPITVTVVAAEPLVTAGPEQKVLEGGELITQGSAPAGQAVIIDWGDGSDTTEATADPEGNISVAHVYADNGAFTVTIAHATEPTEPGHAGSTLVTVDNVAPKASGDTPGDVILPANLEHTLSIVDPGADTFTASVDWGDGSESEPLEVSDLSLTLAHAFVDAGLYSVAVTVTDDDGGYSTTAVPVLVFGAGPLVLLGAPAELSEGTTFIRAGSFSSQESGPFAATVSWGDGSEAEPLALDGDTFSLHHLFEDDGELSLTVTIVNGEGTPGTGTLPLLVHNVAPLVDMGQNQRIEPDEPLVRIGSITDPGKDAIAATADFGDGATETLPIQVDGSVSLEHTWTTKGYFAVTVSATDDDEGVGKHTFLVGVGVEPLLVDAGEDVMLDEGAPLSRVATYTDTQMAIVSATVDYGDGSGRQDLVVDGEARTVTLSHAYADEGDYEVLITLEDAFGSVGVTSFASIVANVAPVVSLGGDAEQPLGETFERQASFWDPGADAWTVLVVWGDGTEEETLTYEPVDGDPNSVLMLSHEYTGSGSYTVTLTVDDGDEGKGQGTLQVVVPNVAPVVALDQASVILAEGAYLALGGYFVDAGTDSWSISVDYDDGLDPGKVTPAADKTFVLSRQFQDDGVHDVVVTVQDGLGEVGIASVLLVVENVAPAVVVSEPGAVDEGSKGIIEALATDPGEDKLEAHIDFGDGSVDTIKVKGEGEIQAQHVWADDGEYTVVITVTDDDGGLVQATTSITVGNTPPTVDAGGHATLYTGVLFTRSGSFVDAGDDTHTATVDFGDGPQPLTLSGASFDLNHTFATAGVFPVVVVVTDDEGATGTHTFNANVADVVPQVDAGNDEALMEGATVTRSGSFTDIESESWTALVDYGDGSESEVLVLAEDQSFELNHTFADNGEFAVVVTITDDDGGVGVASFTASVSNVSPETDMAGTASGTEGKAWKTTFSATDPGADEFSASVDYGDGSDVSVVKVDPEERTFRLSHAYADNGTYVAVLTLMDDDGGAVMASVTVTIDNTAPTVSPPPGMTIDEGSEYVGEAEGTFNDPGADTWVGLAVWGDGTADEALTLSEERTFALAHFYADDGVYTVDSIITDDDGGVGVGTITVTVANVAPEVNAGPDTDTDDTGVFVRAGTFADPGADTWTATVNYGDGAGAQPLTLAEKAFVLDHVFAAPGTFAVTVTVTDDEGATGETTLLVTVDMAAPQVSVDATVGSEGNEVTVAGTFADPGIGPWTATIDFGDGGGIQALEVAEDQSFSLGHIYAQQGEYALTVAVTDNKGLVGVGEAIAGIENVAPTVSLGGASVFEDGVLTREGSFFDPGADSWTATVDFGDGTGIHPVTLSGADFTLDHVFAGPGTYTVTVVIMDDDGGVGTAIIEAHNCAPPEGYAKLWMGGDAAGPSDWLNAANWNPVGVPNGTDKVFVCGSVQAPPALTENASAGALMVAAGATLSLDEFVLTVAGDVAADGPIVGGSMGTIIAHAETLTLRGTFPSLIIKGNATLAGPLTATGEAVIFTGAQLTLNGQLAEFMGPFTAKNSAASTSALVMIHPADRLLLAGEATFGARTTLQDGVIELKSALTQTFVSGSIRPEGTLFHFSGEQLQEVSFKHNSAWLEDVVVSNPVGVRVVTNVLVKGEWVLAPSGRVTQEAGLKIMFSDKLPRVQAGDWDVAETAVVGDLALTADVTLIGATQLTITSGSSVTLNTYTLDVGGALEIANSILADPHLIMTQPTDTLIVGGALIVGGRTQLEQGTISVRGDLIQRFNNEALRPTGTLVVLDGTSPQTVDFAAPGSQDSYLADARMDNVAGVTLAGPLLLMGQLSSSPETTARITADAYTLEVRGGVDVDNLIVDGVPLLVRGLFVRLDHVTFTGFSAEATPLHLSYAALDATARGLIFETTPSTGAYIEGIDEDGPGTTARLTVVDSLPAYGTPAVITSSDFDIVWGLGDEDADGDGFTDAVELTLGTSPVDETDAPLTFTESSMILNGESSAVVVCDVDGDGLQDLAVADAFNRRIAVLRGKASPGAFHPALFIDLDGTPSALSAGDIDGDGQDELVATDNTAQVWILTHDGPKTLIVGSTLTVSGQPTAPAFADANGDGLVDLVIALRAQSEVVVMHQLAGGGFGNPLTIPVGAEPSTPMALDLDLDTFEDVVIPNSASGSVTVLWGGGDALLPQTLAVGGAPSHVLAAGNTLYTATGGSVRQTAWSEGALASSTLPGAGEQVAICDLNADGHDDVVTSSTGGPAVNISLADLSGTYHPPVGFSVTGADGVLCLKSGGTNFLVVNDAAGGILSVLVP